MGHSALGNPEIGRGLEVGKSSEGLYLEKQVGLEEVPGIAASASRTGSSPL